MTSDILAKALPELAGASFESPPAGPFPEIPGGRGHSETRPSSQPRQHVRAQTQHGGLPFLRIASLLKRSDMKSPPLAATPTTERRGAQ